MSETFYILMEDGWDYNDEYYFRGSGGNPELVFTNKNKAEEAAEKKNLERFKDLMKGGDIREYTYDGLHGLLSTKVSEEDLIYAEGIFMTLFGATAEEWFESGWGGKEVKFNTEPTEEQWKQLHKCFDLNFYNVVTVQKG